MTTHQHYAQQQQNGAPKRGVGGTFRPGPIAEVIALANDGEMVSSDYKPFKQMLYQLVDGRSWYCSLVVDKKLKNLNIGVGEPFRCCKREVNGGISVIDVMQVHGDPDETESRIAASTQPRPVAVSPSQNTQPTNHTTEPPSELERQLRASLAVATRRPDAFLLQFYTDAVDLVIAVERYAQTCGRDLRFSSEDIRCIAATSRIDAQKGGR